MDRDPYLMTGGPPSPTLTDYEIKALGGTTTAFETMPAELQRRKAPIPLEQRIVELTKENGRLARDLEYYEGLVKGVLKPVMAMVQFHKHGLDSALRRFNAMIERSNLRWQTDREQSGHADCERVDGLFQI